LIPYRAALAGAAEHMEGGITPLAEEVMIKLHELQPAPGARKAPRRVGRGIGSGMGKTSTRGHKGQWARSGGGVRPGFEGGQMPIHRRLPKRGFTNARFKTVYATVNLFELEAMTDIDVFTPEVLLQTRLVRKTLGGIKVLGDGELTRKITVSANAFSQSAKEKIIAAGGKAEVI